MAKRAAGAVEQAHTRARPLARPFLQRIVFTFSHYHYARLAFNPRRVKGKVKKGVVR